LALLVLLKCFEFLRHFPALEVIPVELVEHVSATLGMAPTERIEFASLAKLYRHHKGADASRVRRRFRATRLSRRAIQALPAQAMPTGSNGFNDLASG
jgi:hypothetical protein